MEEKLKNLQCYICTNYRYVEEGGEVAGYRNKNCVNE